MFGFTYIEEEFSRFKQEIEEQKDKLKIHKLIEQIDEWERESIEKVQKIANDVRDELTSFMSKSMHDIDVKLTELHEKLNQCRQTENAISTIDMQILDEDLKQLKDDLKNITNVNIEHDAIPSVNKIHLVTNEMTCKHSSSIPNLNTNTKWMKNAVTVAGGNGHGNDKNQLNFPFSLFVCHDQTIYITDCENHRVVEWKYGEKIGRIVAGGDKKGSDLNHLNRPLDVIFDKQTDSLIISDYNNRRVMQWPRCNGTHGKTIISNIGCWGLTMDDDGYLYVVDHTQHLVRRYRIGEDEGTIVAGGNGLGNRLDQLSYPTYIRVDRDHSIYISDQSNHRVVKWEKGAKQGTIVAGGQGKENISPQLSNPHGLVIDRTGAVYVVDGENNRILRWTRDNNILSSVVICGDGFGTESNQLAYPTALSIDQRGNLYVCDRGNHRIQMFEIDRSS